MTAPKVELVYFEGCPHVAAARERLAEAFRQAGISPQWIEWDIRDPATPDIHRDWGSPTVLVGGRNVVDGARGSGLGCVVGGAPSVAAIRAALQGSDG